MLAIIRGAGDLATGVIHRLYKCGFKMLVLEIDKPSSIRRTVSFSECIYNLNGEQIVEGVKARKIETLEEIKKCWLNKEIPIAIDSSGKWIEELKPNIVVDAIIAKKNLGTTITMAPITIGLGPGFIAGKDVGIVIETMRGHNLGRIIKVGEAEKNTGNPGDIGGFTTERVIYAEVSGKFKSFKKIGDIVKKDEIIGTIDNEVVSASIDGLLRGIIRDDYDVKKGLKIADIDPRLNQYSNCFTISDKARALGGSVVEAIFSEIVEKGEKDGFKYFGENF
ncbi:MAG: selenium-dependent molybdenum cofactor biosynthesis protein YqeB [Cetobacterium sp.]